jgi:uncharacterized protein YecT (DUF1311 family)
MSLDFPSARAVLVAVACAGPALAQAAGPSFDCARVTSRVNRLICASPELSALDRQLAEHYRVLLGQSGSEAAALQREEVQWLHEVRDPCPDAACIAQAYAVWDAVLVARSQRLAGAAAGQVSAASTGVPSHPPAKAPAPMPLRAAPPPARLPSSPAVAAETQPFAVEPALMADTRALLGHACAAGEDVPQSAGFTPAPGALPVVAADSVVLVRRHVGADFAILLDTRRDTCRMVDAVALPPHAQVGNLLQCVVPADDGSATPLSTGVGLRRPGQKVPLAYWEVDMTHGRLIRQPLEVLGWGEKVRCQEPEVGD